MKKFYNYYNHKGKTCAYCGENSYKYELCNDCYQLAKDEYIIKNEKGNWIKNVRKGNEYKFYDENKKYFLKQQNLNEYEMRYFDIVRSFKRSKYVIIPQVNLQSIIETDSNTRNDELFRNVDFIMFHSKTFVPFLVIELNGKQHYTNEYWIERDKSIKAILDQVQLPLLTIDIKDLKNLNDDSLWKITNRAIKQINPGFFARLFKKETNKMDLSWLKEMIDNEIKLNGDNK